MTSSLADARPSTVKSFTNNFGCTSRSHGQDGNGRAWVSIFQSEILKVGDGSITVKRHIDGGVETVEGPLPIVITVNGSAAPCRPRNAKLVQKYKHAKTITEKQQGNLDYTDLYDTRDYLNLVEWSVADVNGDLKQCGLSGSPTKVKAIQNIVFQAKESKTISGSDREVEELIVELLENHTIG